jgi:hypothetical protein
MEISDDRLGSVYDKIGAILMAQFDPIKILFVTSRRKVWHWGKLLNASGTTSALKFNLMSRFYDMIW